MSHTSATELLVGRDRIQRWVQCGDLVHVIYDEAVDEHNVLHPPTKPDFCTTIPRRLKEYTAYRYVFKQFIYTKCPDAEQAVAGFVATGQYGSRKALFIVWRGTMLSEEWEQNFTADLVNWSPPGSQQSFGHEIHHGFPTLYSSAFTLRPTEDPKRGTLEACMRTGIKDDEIKLIVVTGHSLGGALAMLCAYHAKTLFSEVDVNLVTFSAPRVASVGFARIYDREIKEHIRIATDGDIIPFCPLYGWTPETNNSGWYTCISICGWHGQVSRPSWNYQTLPLGHLLQRLTSIVKDMGQRIEHEVTARFHHAGRGVLVTAAELPDDFNDIVWGVSSHHSLRLILYLLDPTEERKIQLRKEHFLTEYDTTPAQSA